MISGFVIQVYTRIYSFNLDIVCKLLEVKIGSELYTVNVYS